MKKAFSTFLQAILLISIFASSCKKPLPTESSEPSIPRTDTTQTPTPQTPPPPSTFSNRLKQVDIYFFSQGRARLFKGSYLFEYDNSNRVVSVKNNFKTYYRQDTIVYLFDYTGNDLYPSRSIFYNKDSGLMSYTYDTIFFEHNSLKQLIKDSVLSIYGSSGQRIKNLRTYQYLSSQNVVVQWWAGNSTNPTPTLQRIDTVLLNTEGNISAWKTYLSSGSNYLPTTALLAGLNYTSYINPYSLLNISGFPFYLYEGSAARREILGNSYYYAISGTNMIAIFMDLVSKNLLQNFWYVNHNYDGNYVNLNITPDSTNQNYPAKFLITATTSYPDDEYEYDFSY